VLNGVRYLRINIRHKTGIQPIVGQQGFCIDCMKRMGVCFDFVPIKSEVTQSNVTCGARKQVTQVIEVGEAVGVEVEHIVVFNLAVVGEQGAGGHREAACVDVQGRKRGAPAP